MPATSLASSRQVAARASVEQPTTLRVAPPLPRRSRRIKDTIVIFTQVFIPDPASVGQHIADVAFELVRRGYKVRVYTANRGYDDPTCCYPKHETINGVDVRRMPYSSFGKKNFVTRVAG